MKSSLGYIPFGLYWAIYIPFGLYSHSQRDEGFPAKSKDLLSSFRLVWAPRYHVYGDGKEYECGTGSTTGPGGLVQAIQGPYESGTELFARIFQLMKFPRHATVCKSSVKKEQWLDKN